MALLMLFAMIQLTAALTASNQMRGAAPSAELASKNCRTDTRRGDIHNTTRAYTPNATTDQYKGRFSFVLFVNDRMREPGWRYRKHRDGVASLTNTASS